MTQTIKDHTTCENTVVTDNTPLHEVSLDIQFNNVVFRDMAIKDVSFYGCEFINCIFINCSFRHSHFALNCDFNHVIFRNCDLNRQHFKHLKLETTYFEGTSLVDIRIWCARGNGTQIKNMWLKEYPIAYTADSLQIGCQNHLISEWKEFTRQDILKMDGRRALKWWKENKARIFDTIDNAPAEPTTTQS